MCRLWLLSALSASCWAAAWAGGWAMGWQQGAARNASTMWPSSTQSMRTPVLKLHVEALRLRSAAPYSRRSATPSLRLVE